MAASSAAVAIWWPNAGSRRSEAISTARQASAVIMIRRRFHRSTYTPAAGPITQHGDGGGDQHARWLRPEPTAVLAR